MDSFDSRCLHETKRHLQTLDLYVCSHKRRWGTYIILSRHVLKKLCDNVLHVLAWMVNFTMLFNCFAEVAALGLAVGEYVTSPFYPSCASPVTIIQCIAVTAVLTVALLNSCSVKSAAQLLVLLTASKLIVLAIVSGELKEIRHFSIAPGCVSSSFYCTICVSYVIWFWLMFLKIWADLHICVNLTLFFG